MKMLIPMLILLIAMRGDADFPIDPFEPVTANEEWTPYAREFDGVTMMLVPAGSFIMGSTEEQIDFAVNLCTEESGERCPSRYFEDEQPTTEQIFDTPFWIDQTEVTRESWQVCVDEGSCEAVEPFEFSDMPEQPVVRITWEEARTFCEWRGGRLPTEAEWEYSARGPDALIYPWGNTFVPENVIHFNTPEYGNDHTAPVGSLLEGASWVGALDMSGNVFEWTASRYEDYPYEAEIVENFDRDAFNVAVRGRSFVNVGVDLRAAHRLRFNSEWQSEYFGFRCARDF